MPRYSVTARMRFMWDRGEPSTVVTEWKICSGDVVRAVATVQPDTSHMRGGSQSHNFSELTMVIHAGEPPTLVSARVVDADGRILTPIDPIISVRDLSPSP